MRGVWYESKSKCGRDVQFAAFVAGMFERCSSDVRDEEPSCPFVACRRITDFTCTIMHRRPSCTATSPTTVLGRSRHGER
jgi:hypothetical protein